jgi:cytochrome P450
MTFGAGVHACLGASLSIAEMKIAMGGVLDRLPNLRKDPKRWSGTVVRGFQLRSPTKLPVLWDPMH